MSFSMRRIIFFFLCAVFLLPVSFASESSKLAVHMLVSHADAEETVVFLELMNKNSFDARDVFVTFFLNGKEYPFSFPDLERGEKGGRLYTLPALSLGSNVLTVFIDHDDIRYVRTFTLLGSDSEKSEVYALSSLEPSPVEQQYPSQASFFQQALDFFFSV